MRYLANLIVVPLLLAMASISWSAPSVDITDPAQASALVAIQNKIDRISSAVMACIDSGKAHPDCMCQNQSSIVEFNASVTALFMAYPNLAMLDLVQFQAANGLWVTHSLSSIQRQANSPLTCP